MAGYKAVDPTLPDRITKMAELHSHKNAVAGPRMILSAMWMAFIICLVLLGLAAFLAYLGNNFAAGMFGIGPVVTLLVIIFQKLPSQ